MWAMLEYAIIRLMSVSTMAMNAPKNAEITPKIANPCKKVTANDASFKTIAGRTVHKDRRKIA